jgi:hypothetical protein
MIRLNNEERAKVSAVREELHLASDSAVIRMLLGKFWKDAIFRGRLDTYKTKVKE